MNIFSILMAMQGAVAQGVLWGVMTLGVYLTFRVLNIADMTCVAEESPSTVKNAFSNCS